MKIFCAFAFTGEDHNVVNDRMRTAVDTLNSSGHVAYCPLFDPYKIKLQENNDTKAIFEYAFNNIAKQDGLVAIISSPNRSEGMLMEIGAALSKKLPVYVFIHNSAKDQPTHLPKLATKTFYWNDLEDLKNLLKNVN